LIGVNLGLGQIRKLGGNMKKYFEYIGPTGRTKTGETAKFWEITLDRLTVSVRYGKLGANGQVSLKDFQSAEEAEKYADKKIAEKTKDGYLETATKRSFSDDFDYSPVSSVVICRIIMELWDTYKDYPEFDFTDLISYGNTLDVRHKATELELVEDSVIKVSDEIHEQDKAVVQEVFVMFLAKLGLTDEYGFDDLEDVFIHREILVARGEIK